MVTHRHGQVIFSKEQVSVREQTISSLQSQPKELQNPCDSAWEAHLVNKTGEGWDLSGVEYFPPDWTK